MHEVVGYNYYDTVNVAYRITLTVPAPGFLDWLIGGCIFRKRDSAAIVCGHPANSPAQVAWGWRVAAGFRHGKRANQEKSRRKLQIICGRNLHEPRARGARHYTLRAGGEAGRLVDREQAIFWQIRVTIGAKTIREPKGQSYWHKISRLLFVRRMKFNTVVSGCTMDPASAPPIMNKEMITALNSDTLFGISKQSVSDVWLGIWPKV